MEAPLFVCFSGYHASLEFGFQPVHDRVSGVAGGTVLLKPIWGQIVAKLLVNCRENIVTEHFEIAMLIDRDIIAVWVQKPVHVHNLRV